MNPTPVPTPPLAPDALRGSEPRTTLAGLDESIRLIEQRLMLREENLRARFHAFGERLRQASSPKHLLAPVLGSVLAAVVLWRTLRRPKPAGSEPLLSGARQDGGTLSWWMGLLGLAWPMLPAIWRARVSPSAVSTLLSVGLPWIENWLGRNAQESSEPSFPLVTAPHVDLCRYAGRWFEIARLPASFEDTCVGQPTASYRLASSGERGADIEVINRCPAKDGEIREARGVARAAPDGQGARLKVTFLPRWLRWWPAAWADYWILHVDDDYTEALVGHPNRKFLWLLSRQPELPSTRTEALIEQARAQGFPVDQLRFVSGAPV